MRSEADLVFDCGDAVAYGNLAIPTKKDPVWDRLEEAGCSASVPGNRESHVLSAVYRSKLSGASHPILCANLVDRDGTLVHDASMIIDRIGVFGVMVPMVTERMASKMISDFLWLDPIRSACQVVDELRPKVDVIIALTHIGYSQDLVLASRCPGIDIILGGHSHTVLENPEKHGETWIAHTGSHGRFAGLYSYDIDDRALTGGLRSLSTTG